MKTVTKSKTFELLDAATQHIRATYIQRYEELEVYTLVEFRAGLLAVGMDIEKFAPHPSYEASRMRYRTADRKRKLVEMYFQEVASPDGVYRFRRPGDACIMEERPDAEKKLRSAARQAANNLVDSFLFKMEKKISKIATLVESNGNVWDGSRIVVTCEDGERQTWNTKCILNRSCLGTYFNQWPTRREM